MISDGSTDIYKYYVTSTGTDYDKIQTYWPHADARGEIIVGDSNDVYDIPEEVPEYITDEDVEIEV